MSLPTGFHYSAAFLPNHSTYFDGLWDRLDWRVESISMFGRTMRQPRRVAWCADAGVSYRYSTTRLEQRAWDPTLDELRIRLNEMLGARFNSVLCNGYRDGDDSMGWHSDDEPELGPQPRIASVSLGAVRRFRYRSRESGSKRISGAIDLAPGSLLVMDGYSQRDFQHSVPKTRKPVGPRINLTFREILQTD